MKSKLKISGKYSSKLQDRRLKLERILKENDKNKFDDIYNEIKNINKLESKPTELRFLKFNEEFGEFAAEYCG